MTSRNVLRLAAALALCPCLAHAHGDACDKPFQTSGSLAVPVNYSGMTGQFTVPTGDRLQIEQVSGSLRVASSTDRADFQIGTTVGGAFAVHNLAVAEGYTVVDRKAYGPVTLYAARAASSASTSPARARAIRPPPRAGSSPAACSRPEAGGAQRWQRGQR